MPPKFCISACAFLLLCSAAQSATIVLDDFESGEGHFTNAPSFSGTTTGETETAPGVGPSTADWDTTTAFLGLGSQKIFLDDDPNVDVAGLTGVAWRLRHLSGGGTPANNVALTFTLGSDAFVGFYLKTTTPNLRASIMIDDGAALERAVQLAIIPDGDWHLYEWNLANPDQWEPFAGTSPDGVITNSTVTIDSIYIDAVKTAGDQDATLNIDQVSFNPEGSVAVPEPASALFALVGLTVLGTRRRRS
ncbi:PEP-CTERM sorting domain-containing protein [Verrucomicrobiota bacterium sgz303538]